MDNQDSFHPSALPDAALACLGDGDEMRATDEFGLSPNAAGDASHTFDGLLPMPQNTNNVTYASNPLTNLPSAFDGDDDDDDGEDSLAAIAAKIPSLPLRLTVDEQGKFRISKSVMHCSMPPWKVGCGASGPEIVNLSAAAKGRNAYYCTRCKSKWSQKHPDTIDLGEDPVIDLNCNKAVSDDDPRRSGGYKCSKCRLRLKRNRAKPDEKVCPKGDCKAIVAAEAAAMPDSIQLPPLTASTAPLRTPLTVPSSAAAAMSDSIQLPPLTASTAPLTTPLTVPSSAAAAMPDSIQLPPLAASTAPLTTPLTVPSSAAPRTVVVASPMILMRGGGPSEQEKQAAIMKRVLQTAEQAALSAQHFEEKLEKHGSMNKRVDALIAARTAQPDETPTPDEPACLQPLLPSHMRGRLVENCDVRKAAGGKVCRRPGNKLSIRTSSLANPTAGILAHTEECDEFDDSFCDAVVQAAKCGLIRMNDDATVSDPTTANADANATDAANEETAAKAEAAETQAVEADTNTASKNTENRLKKYTAYETMVATRTSKDKTAPKAVEHVAAAAEPAAAEPAAAEPAAAARLARKKRGTCDECVKCGNFDCEFAMQCSAKRCKRRACSHHCAGFVTAAAMRKCASWKCGTHARDLQTSYCTDFNGTPIMAAVGCEDCEESIAWWCYSCAGVTQKDLEGTEWRCPAHAK